MRANNAGAILSTISTTSLRLELTATIVAQNWKPGNVIPTALVNGDRLAVRIYVDDGKGSTMASGRTVTVDYGGANTAADGDSWVSVGENLAPARPTIASITNVADRQMTAGWGLIRGATGYTLAAAAGPGSPPAVIYASSDTVGASATVDTPALVPDTTYYLFVRSNGLGSSSSWAAYPGTATLLAYDPLFTNFTNVTANALQPRENYKVLIDRYREHYAAHGHDPAKAYVGSGSGGLFLADTTEKAIEEYTALVTAYPADSTGLANLALASFYQRDMARALEPYRLFFLEDVLHKCPAAAPERVSAEEEITRLTKLLGSKAEADKGSKKGQGGRSPKN